MERFEHCCIDRILPADLIDEENDLELPGHLRTGPLSTNQRARAFAIVAKRWPNGSTLKVKFLNGSEEDHVFIAAAAHKWSQFANIKFDFGDHPDAAIRVGRYKVIDGQAAGSWSNLGTDCLSPQVPAGFPTMNFEWLDEATVLHEFGHALCMLHEHENPTHGIKWNKAQVYKDLGGPPNKWSRSQIDHNMFQVYDSDLTNGTNFDKDSIMLYPIKASWTEDGFSTAFNQQISNTDAAFIETVYPLAKPAAAGLVLNGPATEAAIGSFGEEDQFAFQIEHPGQYVLETLGQTDMYLSLFGPDSVSNLIAQDDDSGQGSNASLTLPLAPGEYLVSARHFNRFEGTGSYAIRLRS